MTMFKTYSKDGVTLSMWPYESLLVNTRYEAFHDLFDRDAPLYNALTFREFRLLVVYVHAVTFEDDIEATWANAFHEWWVQAAPLVKSMRFDEAWELYCAIEESYDLTNFLIMGWTKTRRDFVPASEVITEAAARSKDGAFLEGVPATSKRSRKRT